MKGVIASIIIFCLLLIWLISIGSRVKGNCGCDHDFVRSEFYILFASSPEEPKYRHPSGYVNVFVCSKCGIVKIPELMMGYTVKRYKIPAQ